MLFALFFCRMLCVLSFLSHSPHLLERALDHVDLNHKYSYFITNTPVWKMISAPAVSRDENMLL